MSEEIDDTPFAEAIDLLDRFTGVKEYRDPYLDAIDNDEFDGGVVRLDVAILALHIWTARTAFKSFPGMIRKWLISLRDSIGTNAALWILEKLSLQALKKLVYVLGVMFVLWESVRNQRHIERQMRLHGVAIRNDLIANRLKRDGTPRQREEVASRHKTPRQRRANGSV